MQLRSRALALSLASTGWANIARAKGGFVPPSNPGLIVEDLPTGIAGIITTVLLLVGVIALGFLVYGGFKYITAQGDERQIDEAKKTISGAVIGILVIGLALAIVLFVSASVGVFS